MENPSDATRQLPPPPPPPKQLLRRPHDGPFGGVCAGVAEYFNVDPTLVRVATVILAFMGPGIPAYLIAWAFVPAADGTSIAASVGPGAGTRDRSTQIFGVALLVIAISVLWGDWWSPARHWLIPLGLIGIGAWLLTRRDDGPATAMGPGPVADPVVGADVTSAAPAEGTSVVDSDPTATRPLPATDDDSSGPTTNVVPPVRGAADNPRRHRWLLGPIVMGALLLWGGVAFMAGADVETGLAVALCIVGVGFVLGAFIGGSWVLIIPAAVLGGLLAAATVIDVPLGGGIGDKTWTVSNRADLQSRYQLGIGEGTLDLSGLAVAPGDEVDIEVELGVGHLVVIVPSGTALEIEAEVGMGKADILGRTDEGIGIDIERDITGDRSKGEIQLDLKQGIGPLEVREASPVGSLR